MRELGCGDNCVGRRGAGRVTRRDGQREAQTVASTLLIDDLQVGESDLDGFVRADVGHGSTKYIRPLLMHDAGALAVRARLDVQLLRFRLFTNLPDDHSL